MAVSFSEFRLTRIPFKHSIYIDSLLNPFIIDKRKVEDWTWSSARSFNAPVFVLHGNSSRWDKYKLMHNNFCSLKTSISEYQGGGETWVFGLPRNHLHQSKIDRLQPKDFGILKSAVTLDQRKDSSKAKAETPKKISQLLSVEGNWKSHLQRPCIHSRSHKFKRTGRGEWWLNNLELMSPFLQLPSTFGLYTNGLFRMAEFKDHAVSKVRSEMPDLDAMWLRLALLLLIYQEWSYSFKWAF